MSGIDPVGTLLGKHLEDDATEVTAEGTDGLVAEELAQNTVVARLAPICVEQFNQDSEKDQKLKKLKEISSWERDDYVEKQGWATMPGEKEADSKVAGKCAELLAELGQ